MNCVFIAVLAMAGILGLSLAGYGVQMPVEEDKPLQADLLIIDGLKEFGALERPPVAFPHDAHTTALAKQDQSCETCHIKKETGASFKFKRLENDGKTTVMELYHNNCIACHKETLKTGMGFCRQCHICSSTCPRGAEIATLMRTHMYAARYSDFHMARTTIDQTGGISGCVECGACRATCAHGVDIARNIEDLKLIYA